MNINWRRTALGELETETGGVIQTGPFGSQLHMSDYSDEGTPVVMPTNIRDMRIDPTDIARVGDEHVDRLVRHQLRPGDILYSRRGDVEKCALVTEHETGWLCGTGCLLVRVQGEHIDTRFLAYQLSTPAKRGWIRQHAVGLTMLNLNTGILREVPIELPDFKEQRRIAGVLGALDDKIESNLRTISLSESLILAHFSSLFNSGHVSAGTALSDLMDVNPRYSLKRESLAIKVSMQDIPSDFPVINTHAVMPVGAGSRFSNGDVLFARISPCLENGKTAIVDFLSSSEVGFGSTEFIVLSPRGEISTTWIYALARDPNFREVCRQAMSGSSGRQRLSADFFSRYTIATPKEFDLADFNKATMPLLTLMGARRDENQRLAQLRDALLPELMSGRMRVDEAGCLVSEALDEEVADV